MNILNPALRIPTRRNTELVLLIFSVLIVVAAEAAVEAARDGKLSSRLVTYAAVPLVAGVITHLVIRKVARYADPLLLPIVVLLNGLGLVMIHRLDLGSKQQAQQNGNTFDGAQAPTQVLWTAIGVSLFIALIVIVRDHRVLQRYAYTLALIGLFFLMLPAVLPARFSEVNGARIWIRLAGFSIQPGEFAKLLLIVFFAGFLVQKRDLFATAGRRFLGMELPRARDLAPLLVAWGLSVGVLVVERDLGTSLLFFGILLVLLYAATERVSWMIIGLAFFAAGATVAYQLFGHVQVRVQVWLDPFADFDNRGYQIGQALFGLGTGGVGGTGLGAGRPDLVPFAESDFMLSTLGEELGLIGLAAILVVYLVMITRGLRSALAVRDSFGKLLATGMSFVIALQTFVVIGGVSKLIPLTGLTLPFLSYGGSSLVANYALVALLLRISNAARAPLTRRPVQPQAPIAEASTEFVQRPEVKKADT